MISADTVEVADSWHLAELTFCAYKKTKNFRVIVSLQESYSMCGGMQNLSLL
jgi:hypothetical protein